jgi:signal transduction histidine kinase
MIDESLEIIAEMMGKVRTLSLNLRPSMLDDLGIVAALDWYIKRLKKNADFEITFEHGLQPDQRFPTPVETALYRVTQEALTNVVRHAQARAVLISLSAKTDRVILSIQDEGVGFKVETALEQKDSTGLQSMKERITLLGGTFSIASFSEEGTIITATIPIISAA